MKTKVKRIRSVCSLQQWIYTAARVFITKHHSSVFPRAQSPPGKLDNPSFIFSLYHKTKQNTENGLAFSKVSFSGGEKKSILFLYTLFQSTKE